MGGCETCLRICVIPGHGKLSSHISYSFAHLRILSTRCAAETGLPIHFEQKLRGPVWYHDRLQLRSWGNNVFPHCAASPSNPPACGLRLLAASHEQVLCLLFLLVVVRCISCLREDFFPFTIQYFPILLVEACVLLQQDCSTILTCSFGPRQASSHYLF
jgi:hypothetical protein